LRSDEIEEVLNGTGCFANQVLHGFTSPEDEVDVTYTMRKVEKRPRRQIVRLQARK
jgi:hypothetical protein